MFNLTNSFNGITLGAATYCRQLDYLVNYVNPSNWLQPASGDASDGNNDYDGDGVSNITELNNGSNPIVN